ncbi:family 10 glycosylhydrolase, partial [candidate division KSB1 bacterium]|nr:family 10 glycosylhydrolase [candidate division KSB1 bacterium]
MYRHLFLFLCSIFILSSCATFRPGAPGKKVKKYPAAEREFRAAWVASVANINWPSKTGLSSEAQKQEAMQLLDLLQRNHFNAVVLQVRPQGDALYKSSLEPWSYYLTGKQGVAPEPFYDPLLFWIEEAHRRGIELHAWLNPYRAHHPSGGEVSEFSIVRTHPELVVQLKNGYWWMDPGLRGTQDHSIAVVMDIVRRYDVDGIHFDDYFYPYPSYNDNQDFPDDVSYQAYRQSGGKLARNDWRRQNVNQFVKRLYKEIKSVRPQVKFGLSPFGIWRPNHPESIRGMDQYDVLFADVKLWLNEGWIDYWSPQLYWTINRIPQSYPVLLGWWLGENKKQRHLWPGINIGLQGAEGIDETLNQIMVTRGMVGENPGNILWSIGPLVSREDLATAVSAGPYKRQALVPATPWLDDSAPLEPKVKSALQGENVLLSWSHSNPTDVFRWVVYQKRSGDWEYNIFNIQDRSARVPVYAVDHNRIRRMGVDKLKNAGDVVHSLRQVLVTAVDRVGNESEPCEVDLGFLRDAPLPNLNTILADYRAVEQAGPVERKPPAVKLGIEVLVEKHLDLIRGKRVGLITNPSAV